MPLVRSRRVKPTVSSNMPHTMGIIMEWNADISIIVMDLKE